MNPQSLLDCHQQKLMSYRLDNDDSWMLQPCSQAHSLKQANIILY